MFVTGELSAQAAQAFSDGAMHFETRDDLIAGLRREIHAGVICLVKGSRSMGMEAVVDALLEESNTRGGC